jgi:MFS family permease
MTAPTDQSQRRAYNANVTKAIAYHGLTHFQLWTAIWVVYLYDYRGFSLVEITTLDSLFFLVAVLAELPTGVVADRFGRKVSLLCGSLTLTVAVFVFGIADNFVIVLVSYVFWGLATAFQSGADSALLYDSMREAGRTSEYTQVQGRLNAVGFAAGLAGGLIGAPIAAATNLAVPVIASAGLAALTIGVALSLREPPRGEHAHASYLAVMRASLARPRRDPGLRYALLFTALASGSTFTVFSQPFLLEHEVGVGLLGVLNMPLRIAAVAGSLYAYRVAAALGDWRFFALTPLLGGVALMGLAGWDSVYAYALFVPLALSGPMRAPVMVRYINDRTPSEVRASVLSLRTLAVSAGMLALEPLAGYLAESYGFRVAFAALAGFCVVSLSVVLWLWRRAEARVAQGGQAGGQTLAM